MKKETAIKRLEARYTGSKNAKAFQLVKDFLNTGKSTWGEINRIRPAYTSGSGRFTSLHDHTASVREILDLIGLKNFLENDSPRGGKVGNFIQITNFKS